MGTFSEFYSDNKSAFDSQTEFLELITQMYNDHTVSEICHLLSDESYIGQFENIDDFVGHYVDECGLLGECSKFVQRYFNYAQLKYDMFETSEEYIAFELNYETTHIFRNQ